MKTETRRHEILAWIGPAFIATGVAMMTGLVCPIWWAPLLLFGVAYAGFRYAEGGW